MAIYKTGDCFVISSRNCWLPGCYEDERTARYAFRFPDKDLQQMQESVNPGNITFKMLQKKALARKVK